MSTASSDNPGCRYIIFHPYNLYLKMDKVPQLRIDEVGTFSLVLVAVGSVNMTAQKNETIPIAVVVPSTTYSLDVVNWLALAQLSLDICFLTCRYKVSNNL